MSAKLSTDSPRTAGPLRSAKPLHSSKRLLVAPFLISLAWFYLSHTVASQSARGLTIALNLREYESFLSAIFVFFLTFVGFASIAWIGSRQVNLRTVLALPQRKGWAREWGVGAAVGWGIVIIALLPMVLTGTLWPQFWFTGHAFWLTLIALLTAAFGTLVEEIVFRGYPFRLLIDGIGPSAATLVMAFIFALFHPLSLQSPALSFCGSLLLGILLAMAYLRTHALWLPWGLHFAWSVSMGLLFGLPVQGNTDLSTLIEIRAIGPLWLTGGAYGPAAAVWTLLVLIVGMFVLFRVSRDYAWNYTHAPIVPGGYPLEVKAPPAHEAMEQEAQKKAGGLVQILPTTPRGPQGTPNTPE